MLKSDSHTTFVHVGRPFGLFQFRGGCQFIHSLFRSLCHLPGGLVRFVSCQPSAHCTRLLHFGWEQCGHAFLLVPVKAVTCWLCTHFFFWDHLEAQMLLKTLSLDVFPPGRSFTSSPVVGPCPGFRIHFPDHDPVEWERELSEEPQLGNGCRSTQRE